MALQFLPSFSHTEPPLVAANRRPTNLLLPRDHHLSRSTLAFSRGRHRNSTLTTSSSSKQRKKSLAKKDVVQDEEDLIDDDDDPFEALFSQLEEDLKNDDASNDDDDDINEEDIELLARELEEALGADDGVNLEMSDDKGSGDDNDDDDEEEEEEAPLKLKNWQLKRLARALKVGRRKTSIKNLAGELCLDRAVVLELLRDPPPNLVMLSAALPDEPEPIALVPETKTRLGETVFVETGVDTPEPKTKRKEPVHVMRHSWAAQKRLKKVQVETLERVYRKSKRPTNAMISSIVHVTNLPRKRVVKWFEDKRAEEGVPDHRQPYQRPVSETVFS